jgi:hypothetical protein
MIFPSAPLYFNLLRSILGFKTTFDFMISSQVTSRFSSAEVRAMMQEIADSAPASA